MNPDVQEIPYADKMGFADGATALAFARQLARLFLGAEPPPGTSFTLCVNLDDPEFPNVYVGIFGPDNPSSYAWGQCFSLDELRGAE